MDDLVGKKFTKLTVIKFHSMWGGKPRWDCCCDCGKRTVVSSANLKAGGVKSCGCLKYRSIHGYCKTREYRALSGAIDRCRPDYKQHADYYDRGIRVCPQWSQLTKEAIEDFIIAVGGLRPSAKHSLDRIDNNRGYEPGNVRWATAKEQKENQRKRARIDQFSVRELLAQCKKLGVALGFKEPDYLTLNHAIV